MPGHPQGHHGHRHVPASKPQDPRHTPRHMPHSECPPPPQINGPRSLRLCSAAATDRRRVPAHRRPDRSGRRCGPGIGRGAGLPPGAPPFPAVVLTVCSAPFRRRSASRPEPRASVCPCGPAPFLRSNGARKEHRCGRRCLANDHEGTGARSHARARARAGRGTADSDGARRVLCLRCATSTGHKQRIQTALGHFWRGNTICSNSLPEVLD